jgi:hypothetical protein
LSALVCGGWPPLGAPYSEMLDLTKAIAENPPEGLPEGSTDALKQWVTYYSSIQDWPEKQAVSGISCPRLTFAGSDDEMELQGIKVRIAATIRDHREELESLGWKVDEIPGRDHNVTIDPDAVVPLVRSFLDEVT